ncbi:hypothetical protein CoNPh8_CDS0171 [Staphylococcus phage S-CoN_Ph8]|nr:hypothetical protein CoNPh7_CDS0006 [Staphylococcus phage S-CoN_Ph7]WNM52724.1 hypothetical protein CoNPh8_CDS0171 [Staphylococcus phage S-CoN_Ph8]
MKRKGRVFQVIGLTNTNQQKFFVFDTEKSAKAFVEKQNFLAMHQIIPIDVNSFK